jgi:hypothetical protein
VPDSFAFFYVLYLRAKPIPNRTFCQMTGLSKRSLYRKVKVLVEAGYLVNQDVNKYRITDILTDSLSVNTDILTDSVSVNTDSLSSPYIENGKNGKVTVMNGARTNREMPKETFVGSSRRQTHQSKPSSHLADGFHLPRQVQRKIQQLKKCADCFRDAQSCWYFDTQMPRAAPYFVRAAFLMPA